MDEVGCALGLALALLIGILVFGPPGVTPKADPVGNLAAEKADPPPEAKPFPWAMVLLIVYGVIAGLALVAMGEAGTEPGRAFARAALWPLVLLVAVVREIPSILRGR